ncbi:MAG: aconitase X, partial [Desulfurococcaceae archaeon]
KNLLASAAASGNHALIVIEGVTPRNTFKLDLVERVEVDAKMLEGYMGGECHGTSILGYIGCPHASPRELLYITRLLKKYRKPRRGKLLVTMPAEFARIYRDLVLELKAMGVDIAAGTCPVVSRFRGDFDCIITNSGKALFYLKRIYKTNVKLAGVEAIVRHLAGA